MPETPVAAAELATAACIAELPITAASIADAPPAIAAAEAVLPAADAADVPTTPPVSALAPALNVEPTEVSAPPQVPPAATTDAAPAVKTTNATTAICFQYFFTNLTVRLMLFFVRSNTFLISLLIENPHLKNE
jgi:hypothetical protein